MPGPLDNVIKAAATQAVKAMKGDVDAWKTANGGTLPSDDYNIKGAQELRYKAGDPASVYIVPPQGNEKQPVIIVNDPNATLIFTGSKVKLGGATGNDVSASVVNDAGAVNVKLVTNKGTEAVVYDLSNVKMDEYNPKAIRSFHMELAEGNPTLRLGTDPKVDVSVNRVSDSPMVLQVPAVMAKANNINKDTSDQELDLGILANDRRMYFIHTSSDANNVSLQVIDPDNKNAPLGNPVLLKDENGLIPKKGGQTVRDNILKLQKDIQAAANSNPSLSPTKEMRK